MYCKRIILRTHAIVLRRPIPIRIKSRLPPIFGCLPFAQRAKTSALHLCIGLQPGKIEIRRTKIHIHHNILIHRTRRNRPRIPHHIRHQKRLFQNQSLIKIRMLAQKHTLVRRIYHNRILRQPLLIQKIQQPPHTLVNRRNTPQIILHIFLISRVNLLLCTHPRRIQPSGGPLSSPDALIHPLGLHQYRAVVILQRAGHLVKRLIQIRRLGQIPIREQIRMPRRVLPQTMRRFVMAQHQKRLIRIARLQPVERQIRNNIRRIPLVLRWLAIARKRRIKISTLPRQHLPIIKPIRLRPQMPLTCNTRLISGSLQLPNKIGVIIPQRLIQPQHPIFMAILPRNNTRPARRTQRIIANTIIKPHALTSDAVNIRCIHHLIQPSVITTNGIHSMIIRHNVENIRTRIRH